MSQKVDVVWGFDWQPSMPDDSFIINWAERALAECATEGEFSDAAEVTIKIVSRQEMTELNSSYRDMDKPTNVLSFPLDVAAEEGRRLLGDIAICMPVVLAEAAEQGKSQEAHFAHMIVHGVLHLSGLDHLNDDQAAEMERIETRILNIGGFPDPYSEDLV